MPNFAENGGNEREGAAGGSGLSNRERLALLIATGTPPDMATAPDADAVRCGGSFVELFSEVKTASRSEAWLLEAAMLSLDSHCRVRAGADRTRKGLVVHEAGAKRWDGIEVVEILSKEVIHYSTRQATWKWTR